jgi:deoxyribodipyrimidine photolyase-related protein
MHAFARELSDAGRRVDYVKLDDPKNTGSFSREIARAVARHKPGRQVSTRGSEHRLASMQEEWAQTFALAAEI